MSTAANVLPRRPYGGQRRHRPAVEGTPPIEIRDLAVRHPGASQRALEAVDLTVDAGCAVALLGANGSGKSTLLHAITGALALEEGSVRVFGREPREAAGLVSHLAQKSEVNWQFPITVRRAVLTGRFGAMGWFGRCRREHRQAVDHVLAQLGLTDLADRAVRELSGGQQQRTLLARTLVQGAPLILLDEPLNAVDAESREVILETLLGLRRAGKTIVMATHHVEDKPGLFDESVWLAAGRRVSVEGEGGAAPCSCG